MNKPIYLDNQATTPLDPAVLEAMLPYLKNKFGNAASVHHIYGREGKEAVENSRKLLAESINGRPRDIIFTSGATESINLAIKGVCKKYQNKGKHVVTQQTEHKAVLDTCASMEKMGWRVTYLPVNSDGIVNPNSVFDAIEKDTVLVTVMHANNEIGTIQPIAEIGAICRQENTFFMVDACQSFGKLDIDVNEMNIDLMAATAHKIYGPKGVGLLYVRQKDPKVKLEMQMDGGGHERGLRSGTLAVPQIVGFAKAVELFMDCKNEENQRLSNLRDKMLQAIKYSHPDVILNGSIDQRLAHNLNLCFPGLEAESLIMKMKDIACSTGSACSSANLEPSHVIKALGYGNELAHSAIRFSLGRFNTEEEIEIAIAEVISTVSIIKKKSPHYKLINV
jgi:cysteine desulfurase